MGDSPGLQFVAANDNHFHYPPAILSIFLYVRRYLDFVSLSVDGISPPEIYHRRDIDLLADNPSLARGYEPSPVDVIDDLPAHEWLQREASYRSSNFQDPDAQYNGDFTSIPNFALSRVGMCIMSEVEVPDSYTVYFKNDTGLIVDTMVMFAPGVNFSGIDSGETFHERFEVAPEGVEVGEFAMRSMDLAQDSPVPGVPTVTDLVNELLGGNKDEDPHVIGYPLPVAIHTQKSVAGYFLEGPEDRDVAVLSILDFYPVLGSALAGANFNITDYIIEARTVLSDFFRAAHEDGRTRLVIDMSGNTGGAIVLSQEIYRLLFPDGDLNIYDRKQA